MFEDIVETHEMRDDADIDHLADMVSAIIEGGLILSRAVEEPSVTAQQVRLLQSYVKLLFVPKPV